MTKGIWLKMDSNGPPEPEYPSNVVDITGTDRLIPEGDIGKNVYSPKRIKELTWSVVADRITYPGKGIATGIEALDKVVLPMRPGEVIGILGYTSNFKTGLMNNMAHFHAKRIRDENLDNQIVIRFDWEMAVEEQGVIDLARITQVDASKMMKGQMSLDEYDRLKIAADERERLPLWLVGHSSEGHERRPRLSMDDVHRSLEFIVDKLKLEPVLVLIDYLQRVRRLKKEMRESYMDIVDDTKDIAIDFHCPTMLGCQSGRKVKSRTWRMPRADDAQETSNFEQTIDKGMAVWMPKNDFPVGTMKTFGARHYEITKNMLLINLFKQKFGQSPWLIETHVNFDTFEIFPVTYQSSFMENISGDNDDNEIP
jgi:hypothetical protein